VELACGRQLPGFARRTAEGGCPHMDIAAAWESRFLPAVGMTVCVMRFDSE